MIELPFGTDALKYFIDFRTDITDIIFRSISYMGEVEGYILIITFIYMLYDKKLAFRLSIIALISMSLNHLFKSIIGLQRPFVKEGTFLENWLVSKENALELVSENSMPSGHAMSSSAFYGYLITVSRSTNARLLLLLVIILVGASRPYLAVHFIEDILLGWVCGFLIIMGVTKYFIVISELWSEINLMKKMFLLFSLSALLWILTYYLNGGTVINQPLPFVGYLGFLIGVCLGFHLENLYLDFDPKSKKWPIKLLRWITTVLIVMIPVVALDEVFEEIWEAPTFLSHLIQYLGYAFSGFLGIFLAPWIFLKLDWVDKISNDSLLDK